MSPAHFSRNLSALAVLALLCAVVRPDAAPRVQTSTRMTGLPARTLWVWERPEDMRAVDPTTTALAALDQMLLVGPAIEQLPRRQTVVYPAGATRIAVVRIETRKGARLDLEQARATAALSLESAREPGVAALQIDFDARRSERAFYAAVLAELHRRMPAEMPLSMTALASWCSSDDWIGGLPVDEAVPMFFRMEPDRDPRSRRPEFRIREPLCQTSVGVSTHEPWPEGIAGKRVYVFADRGWRADYALLAERKLR
ncbi:MAG: DUF3142 domain-containing protein [Terracidiphilus sp.]|nr:DUF3142 domain-containing protein [Terracidiphilus sp.]